MGTRLALRVDVDTRRGLLGGVPRLLELFSRLEIRASFFVTFGPDRSGLAIRRAWRPSFLLKMWRTNPFRLYGMGTLLSGTLLRPQLVGAGSPDLLRQMATEGHEICPHGYDHFGWLDRVHRMTAGEIEHDLEMAAAAYRDLFGHPPSATAAPGWRCTPEGLAIQDRFRFVYASDVRGTEPFRPVHNGETLKTIQIPTTLPTVDELLGRCRDVAGALGRSLGPGLNVLTTHAEVEGGAFVEPFRRFLDGSLSRGVRILPLGEVAKDLLADGRDCPRFPVVRGRIPGRSGWIAIQGRL